MIHIRNGISIVGIVSEFMNKEEGLFRAPPMVSFH